MATLLSAIVCLEAKATDDALELFDLIVTSELLARAEWASKTEKLRRDPRLSRDAGKLAAANRVYCLPACRQEAYRRRSVGIGPAAVRRAEAARVAELERAAAAVTALLAQIDDVDGLRYAVERRSAFARLSFDVRGLAGRVTQLAAAAVTYDRAIGVTWAEIAETTLRRRRHRASTTPDSRGRCLPRVAAYSAPRGLTSAPHAARPGSLRSPRTATRCARRPAPVGGSPVPDGASDPRRAAARARRGPKGRPSGSSATISPSRTARRPCNRSPSSG
jgi:hypothetical protein